MCIFFANEIYALKKTVISCFSFFILLAQLHSAHGARWADACPALNAISVKAVGVTPMGIGPGLAGRVEVRFHADGANLVLWDSDKGADDQL